MRAHVEPTEREWQQQVIDLAHIYHWRVAHFRPAQTRHGWRTPVSADGAGFPDLVLIRERVIFAELKAKRGRLSEDQQAWLAALNEAGAENYVWRPAELDGIAQILTRRSSQGAA